MSRNKKGGNAVRATRKPPLGRASAYRMTFGEYEVNIGNKSAINSTNVKA